MIISLIVALSLNRVIGVNNQLPWHLPADLRAFKKRTIGHHLLMGRHTFESIGHILPNRTSIVVSRSIAQAVQGYYVVRNIEDGIKLAKKQGEKELFVIGGGHIYAQLLPLADRIYLTEVDVVLPGDVYFPDLGPEWMECSKHLFKADAENSYNYAFLHLEKRVAKTIGISI